MKNTERQFVRARTVVSLVALALLAVGCAGKKDEVPGESFHLGAGFRLLSILIGGNRLGDVLLHFLQLAERQCLEIEISH